MNRRRFLLNSGCLSVTLMLNSSFAFSSNSNLGDSVLGLPVGSLVAGTGEISFFNQDNLISNKNKQVISNNKASSFI